MLGESVQGLKMKIALGAKYVEAEKFGCSRYLWKMTETETAAMIY